MTASFVPVVLETERLSLRWIDEGDSAEIFHIYSNKTAMRYWSSPAMQSIDEAKSLIARFGRGYETKQAIVFGIVEKASQRLIGTISLFAFFHESRRAELGYILGRDHWGQGLMNEALVAAVGYAFGQLNLNRLEADIDPRNNPSRKTLLRLGFQPEGHLRQRWIVQGEVTDSELYGLLQCDWQSRL